MARCATSHEAPRCIVGATAFRRVVRRPDWSRVEPAWRNSLQALRSPEAAGRAVRQRDHPRCRPPSTARCRARAQRCRRWPPTRGWREAISRPIASSSSVQWPSATTGPTRSRASTERLLVGEELLSLLQAQLISAAPPLDVLRLLWGQVLRRATASTTACPISPRCSHHILPDVLRTSFVRPPRFCPGHKVRHTLRCETFGRVEAVGA